MVEMPTALSDLPALSDLRLRPSHQRRRAFRREAIDTALEAEEPAVDIVQQDLGRIWNRRPDFGRPARTVRERCRAGERPLAVGGHDRHLARAAGGWIADAAPMLVDD